MDNSTACFYVSKMGDLLTKSNGTSLPPMEVMSTEENNLIGRVSARNKQMGSRQGVVHQQNGSWTRRCSELCVRGLGPLRWIYLLHVSTAG